MCNLANYRTKSLSFFYVLRNIPGVDVAKLANFTIKMPFLVSDIRNNACLSIFYDLELRNFSGEKLFGRDTVKANQ